MKELGISFFIIKDIVLIIFENFKNRVEKFIEVFFFGSGLFRSLRIVSFLIVCVVSVIVEIIWGIFFLFK